MKANKSIKELVQKAGNGNAEVIIAFAGGIVLGSLLVLLVEAISERFSCKNENKFYIDPESRQNEGQKYYESNNVVIQAS